MRVLLVHDYATRGGGAEILTVSLRDRLRERGHDARLFSSTAGLVGDESDPSGPEFRCFGTTSRFRTLLQTANPSAARQLRRVLADFRPDVVHVRMFLTQLSPLILPALRDVPSLCHVVWYRPICPTGLKVLPDGSVCSEPAGVACYRNGCVPARDWPPLMLQGALWRRWRGVFDRVVANSRHVADRLEHEGIRPVEVIPNGVPFREPRGELSPAPLAVFAGRLVREKGAELLLRAFSQVVREVPRARLILAGEGPERSRLCDEVERLGLSKSVELPGYLPAAALESLFEGAWLQVVPSQWEEPFGLVAAEAMMRGTAVIATRIGALPEIVQAGETGLLVSPGEEGELARALVTCLSDRDLCERYGTAGRIRALDLFRDDQLVERFLCLYRELVAPARPVGLPVVSRGRAR